MVVLEDPPVETNHPLQESIQEGLLYKDNLKEERGKKGKDRWEGGREGKMTQEKLKLGGHRHPEYGYRGR